MSVHCTQECSGVQGGGGGDRTQVCMAGFLQACAGDLVPG